MTDHILGLLCVHAHPDDEAIATGGTLARYADEGLRTAVVTCTGGELGEIVGDGMDPDKIRPRLGEVRREELAKALAILGAGEPRLLGYRDSGMHGTDGNADPASFWQAPFDQAVGRLVAQIREFQPDVVVTYDPFGGYGHPDHVQTHRVGLIAAEAAAVAALHPDAGAPWRVRKVYLSTLPRETLVEGVAEMNRRGIPTPFGDLDLEAVPLGMPRELVTTTLDVRPWLDRKEAALAAHHSQVGDGSFFLNVPEDLRGNFFGNEWYIRQRSDVPAPSPEDDLFAGLRS